MVFIIKIMAPVLLQFGPMVIYSYGLFIVIAFFVGLFSIWRVARDYFNSEQIVDAVIFSTVLAIVFGRLGYILVNLGSFEPSLTRIVGFVWYGGFDGWATIIGWGIGLWLWARRHNWDFFRFADLAISGGLVSYMLVLIGDFLGGVSTGRNTDLIWAQKPVFAIYPQHPVALYQLLSVLVVFYITKKLAGFRPYAEKPFSGFVFLVGVFVLCLVSFAVEFTKSDRLYFGWLTEGQIVNLGLVGFAAVLFWVRSEKLRKRRDWASVLLRLFKEQASKDFSLLNKITKIKKT